MNEKKCHGVANATGGYIYKQPLAEYTKLFVIQFFTISTSNIKLRLNLTFYIT